MNEHIELPALPEVIQMGSRSAKDVMREYARAAILADRAAQQRVLAEQAEPDDPNYPFYELKFIMRVLGHEGRAPREDWQTACGMARAIFTRWHSEKIASPPAPQEAQAGWKHDCAGLCTNGLELWIENCPHCGMPREYAAPVAQPATEQAEAPNPLADYHRDQYEHAFNGWEACKQECDRLRDELEEATQPTASNAGERETLAHRPLSGELRIQLAAKAHAAHDASLDGNHRECRILLLKILSLLSAPNDDAPSQIVDALGEYANPLNWSEDGQGIRRLWREPGSGTPDAYNGFEMARAALASKPAEPVAPPAGEALRALIHGMSVSVDVSTNDETAGHRYMGTVTEVMDDLGDKHGLTLLVQDAEPNFSATTPAPAGQKS